MGCRDAAGVDLHIHSTASDGTLSPGEIVNTARQLGLKAIAITDHDTLAGVRAAIDGGIPQSLRFLTGLEISAASPRRFPCHGSFHILGYAIRPDDPPLNRALVRLQEARKNRNPRIIGQLRQLGFDITLKEVAAHAGDAQIGRPHIARLMKEKGFVCSVEAAFDRYLGTGKPAYADKYRISCREAISLIRGAGGIAVLAHPGLLKPVRPFDAEEMIAALRAMGLKGIEVFYPEHDAGQTAFYGEIARRYGLVKTGGTDFHGAIKPGLKMGSGNGDGFCVPFSVYEAITRSV
ncbi:ribonuclease III [Desulfonema ishimotonii]|uniref:Ribonuclease III n=1 Tax=Desulfonema ishimotonii TaxID=45657 RepID=A0A401G0G2_9BACT|nr:PHP domain-containing protein [Desulfonema ishimotonii]GBC62722.1 ribonuclease III [Desulfonema ishimotonii]